MNDPVRLWADPRLAYTVAAISVALLVVAIWLFGRRRRHGRQAGVICLILSIAFHLALIILVPMLPSPPGGSSTVDPESNDDGGIDSVAFSTFDPEMSPVDAADEAQAMVAPLPVSDLTELLDPQPLEPSPQETTETVTETESQPEMAEILAGALASLEMQSIPEITSDLDSFLEEAFAEPADDDGQNGITYQISSETTDSGEQTNEQVQPDSVSNASASTQSNPTNSDSSASAPAPRGTVISDDANDFANRTGAAKEQALLQTGGSYETEAAVELALRFLVSIQRSDGAWDPRASGAGVERAPLGTARGGAGSRAEMAITGLALLSLMGAGHTHQQGEYSDAVFRGLAYLIRNQKPDGSLAGNASVYEATYCHGMAALALGEAAAITHDPSAILSARRAIAYTQRIQHPGTGGWRYTEGDPGDLSQLGWQAMVLDAGSRAGIQLDPRSVAGVQRFLHSVRMGSQGGLACYRRGEAPSRTMTAEALATRLLIGERVPQDEIVEAERYLLQQPPGVGQDNYYYWYYATLALHQLQDDAWQQWNESLKRRLVSTQRSDGSWSSDTMWGGYGGTVYTTSMAALCLETYYRHTIRGDNGRIAQQPNLSNGR